MPDGPRRSRLGPIEDERGPAGDEAVDERLGQPAVVAAGVDAVLAPVRPHEADVHVEPVLVGGVAHHRPALPQRQVADAEAGLLRVGPRPPLAQVEHLVHQVGRPPRAIRAARGALGLGVVRVQPRPRVRHAHAVHEAARVGAAVGLALAPGDARAVGRVGLLRRPLRGRGRRGRGGCGRRGGGQGHIRLGGAAVQRGQRHQRRHEREQRHPGPRPAAPVPPAADRGGAGRAAVEGLAPRGTGARHGSDANKSRGISVQCALWTARVDARRERPGAARPLSDPLPLPACG